MRREESPGRTRTTDGFLMRHQIWVWGVVVLSVLVVVVIAWLHFQQRETLGLTVKSLDQIREARIELNEGFLHVMLAGDPGSPFERERGLALLEQAVGSVSRAAAELERGNQAAREFQDDVRTFRALLESWSQATEPRSDVGTKLRIAFHRLERRADEIDDSTREGLRRLSHRLDSAFVATLAGSALFLFGICCAAFVAGRANQASVAGRNRAEQARLKAEDSLRESERRFRQLVGSLPQLVWTCDPSGACDFLSPQWVRFTGAPAETQLGTGWLERVHPDDRAGLKAAWGECLAGRDEFRAEFRIRRHDGTYRWFDSRAVPLRDVQGRIVKWFGSNTDVDDERKIREALVEEKDRLAKIAATVPGAIHSLRIRPDGTSHFPYASPAFQEIYGLRPDEVAEDASPVLSLVHPDDRHHLAATVAEATSAVATWHAEFRVNHPTKGQIWVEGRSVPQKEPDGSTVWHGILTDITERKRAEESALRSQKLEALGTLAGGIAHDFNNLLLAITGNAHLAVLDLPPAHPAQACLQEIDKASARASDLVRRIMSFSRPGEHKRENIRLAPLVDEVLKLMRATLPAIIQIRSTASEDVPVVAADPTQLHQILVNLLTNAAHAIGARRGRIDLSLDLVELDAERASTMGLCEGKHARLTISDDGCGMGQETLERIFDPFFTTKPFGQGTGLGLSVVHGIVKSHDGAITVSSEPDKGTTFQIYLPKSQGPVPGVPERRTEPLRPGTGRVLYIDDEEALVFLATRTLRRMGYEVTGMSEPARALEAFKARVNDFDLVVTDLSMPGMSGFELARQILELRPELPILMTSGYARPEDRDMALRMGIRDLILKPSSIAELGQTLDRWSRSQGLHASPSADAPSASAGGAAGQTSSGSPTRPSAVVAGEVRPGGETPPEGSGVKSTTAESPPDTRAAESPGTTPAAESSGTTPGAEGPGTTPGAERPGTTSSAEGPGTTSGAERLGTMPAAERLGTTPGAEGPGEPREAESPRNLQEAERSKDRPGAES